MQSIPYDATRESLYQPGNADDFFVYGPYDSDAAVCAEMARVAYVKSRTAAGEFLKRGDFDLTDLGDAVFLATHDQLVVLVFRGTESGNLEDVGTDVDFAPCAWPYGGQVHHGFAARLDTMWGDIEGRIPDDGRRVVVTGHSLGAALATLAASRHPPNALYTFGSPLVGDVEFGETLRHVRHCRYVNCCDIVTRVPPEFLNFKHFGTLHYIDRFGAMHIDPGEDLVSADRRNASRNYLMDVAHIVGSVTIRELADHAPINYVSGTLGRRGTPT